MSFSISDVLRTVPGPRQELGAVSSHSVLRAWHKASEQYVLVPLVLFSYTQFLNGLGKIKKEIALPNQSTLLEQTLKNFHFQSFCVPSVCLAFLSTSALTTVLKWSLSLTCSSVFRFSPFTSELRTNQRQRLSFTHFVRRALCREQERYMLDL